MSLLAEVDFGLTFLTDSGLNQTCVLTPITVGLALSLLHLGASGEIKEKIKNVICQGSYHNNCTTYFSSLQSSLLQTEHPYFNHSDDSLQNTTVLTNFASHVFAPDNVNIVNTLQNELNSMFNASLQSLDYHRPDHVTQVVNDYIKQVTAGKIAKLMEKDSFEGKGARLVNAALFHGKWSVPFAEDLNYVGKFYKSKEVFKGVNFMKHSEKKLPLLITENFMTLGLPYKDERYRLTIILPRKRFELAKHLKDLTSMDLYYMINNNENYTVNVVLPKFKFEAELELSDVLREREEPASLQGNHVKHTESHPAVSTVLNKVTFDFNEQGTTAASSSTLELLEDMWMFNKEKPIDFVADHPFLFVLSMEGHILYTGQYYG